MPKIQLITPEGEKFEYELTEPSTTFGRAPENDLVIPDGSVSSRHGKFNLKGESIEIEDLGSTNGTHAGGQRVERVDIAPGGTFRLGNVQGTLLGAPAPAEEPASAAPAAPKEAPAEEAQEEEARAPGRTWSPSGSGAVIAGLGATPCPTKQRVGFGPKQKVKDTTGTTFMTLAIVALAVSAGAAFFIFKMGAA